jgi:hypothetical protein
LQPAWVLVDKVLQGADASHSFPVPLHPSTVPGT